MPASRSEHVLTLRGHLSLEALDAALSGLRLPSGATADLIIDVAAMTGYDGAARERFVAWHQGNRSHIAAVAIVGAKPLWRMVIHAMGLAAGVPMKPVADFAEARAWLARR